MPIGNVDYDRGVIIINHAKTGMDIFMYVDDPGKFLNAHSAPVSDELAKEAGFDVDKLSKERIKKERKQQAMQLIDAELSSDNDVREEVVEERNEYKIVATGAGRHHVVDPEQNRLSSFPLSLEDAKKLLNGMAGTEVSKPATGAVVGRNNK